MEFFEMIVKCLEKMLKKPCIETTRQEDTMEKRR